MSTTSDAKSKTKTTKKSTARSTARKAKQEKPVLIFTKDDADMFHNGMWQRAWEKMGAHPDVVDGQPGWRFRVWAPDCTNVSVVGDFNDWTPGVNNLVNIQVSDIWDGFVPGLQKGDLYKFVIQNDDGDQLWKADPYAFLSEVAPGTASKLWTMDPYAWTDGRYLASRRRRNLLKNPLNIYEVHLGSWRRHGNDPQGEPGPDGTYPGPGDPFPAQRGTYYTYDELAEELVDYASEMGYSHIELLPLAEHPFDGSWGYQPTGYYSATARYGTPQQLMHLVDAAHAKGIGIIMDWVPGGFCADAHGLATFNGKMLYEHEIHPNWGTHKFDFGRPEVRSFLVSNVFFWIENFHLDGIRMDGVSSMLYLNFGIDDPGQKRFNKYGTEEDLEASAFIRQVNCAVHKTYPNVLMIAEESTAWPKVTAPADSGGLAFDLKWDMGWMNDTLSYMQCDFPWRPGNHTKLTFSMMYNYSEHFILPLSHDEVVNGKCSLIGRMPGDWWRQFAGLRCLAFHQMTHPGGKLNFMGNEIGQFIEWRYYESIEWFMAEQYETHGHQQKFIAALNHLYLEEPALWQHSFDEKGFEWIDADNNEQSMIAFTRHGNRVMDDLVVVINFDPASYQNFRMGVPREGDWEVIFNTDDPEYGGSGFCGDQKVVSSRPEPYAKCKNSVLMRVPPLGGVVLKRIGKSSYVAPAKPKAGAKSGAAGAAAAAAGAAASGAKAAKDAVAKRVTGKKTPAQGASAPAAETASAEDVKA